MTNLDFTNLDLSSSGLLEEALAHLQPDPSRARKMERDHLALAIALYLDESGRSAAEPSTERQLLERIVQGYKSGSIMASDKSGYINAIMDAEKWLSENRT